MRIWRIGCLLIAAISSIVVHAQDAPRNEIAREKHRLLDDTNTDAVVRDLQGRVRHLRYQDHRVNAKSLNVGDATARPVADAYLRRNAAGLSISDDWIALDKFVPDGITDAPDKIQFAQAKSLGDTTAVTYVQTKFGLLVWKSGIAITIVGKENPYVANVASSVDPGIEVSKPGNENQFPTKRPTEAELAKAIDVDPDRLRINSSHLMIYRYQKSERLLPQPQENDPNAVRPTVAVPSLPLPPVPDSIVEDTYHVVNDVDFRLPVEGIGDVNWRVFIDLKTGNVLYLRPGVAFATGRVFRSDPASDSGDPVTPLTAVVELNRLRSPLQTMEGLTPSVGGNQSLTGNEFVTIEEKSKPVAAIPMAVSPFEFDYSVETDNFAAVSAYYHCDATFRLVVSFGVDVRALFGGTPLPVPVDHRAISGSVNAMVLRNSAHDGVESFLFGLAGAGSKVGMGADKRIVLHEFCHAILWNSSHAGTLGFAESGGDSLAAIMNAPNSRAPDPNQTFPWTIPNRRHDRLVTGGWGWGGSRDVAEYDREQILSTSLFRMYRAIGGDDANPATKMLGARSASNLLVRGLGLLNPYTPTSSPEILESAMIAADKGTASLDGIPGGALHKVLRWTFAKQGLHRPVGQPTNTEGGPPAVDVYIDDGRNGDYWPYLTDWTQTRDIWNRLSPDGADGHQTPVRNQRNYLYVRIRNRGTQVANDVSVRVHNRVPGTAASWPHGMHAVTTAVLPAAGDPVISVPPGGERMIGPFRWQPESDEDQLLATVSASGDLSNIDPSSPLPVNTGPTPLSRLVPFDNNIAVLSVTSMGHPDFQRLTVGSRPVRNRQERSLWKKLRRIGGH